MLGALARALPLRRGAPAGRRRPDDHRRPRPPDHAGRGLRAAQGGRVLAGPAGAAARVQRRHRRCTAPATPTSTRCCRPRRSWPTSRSWWRSRSWSSPTRACATWSGRASRWPCSASPRWRSAASTRAAVQTFRSSRARGQGGAVHPAQHRRDPRGVRADRRADRRRTRRATLTPPATLATDTTGGAEHPAARPAAGRPRRTPSSSRSAASTTSARSWTSTGTRSTARLQDYVVGVREINYGELTDQQNNWHQPAHRLHPRLRLGRRAGQPGGLRRAAVLRLRLPRRAEQPSDGVLARRPSRSRPSQPRIYYGERMRPTTTRSSGRPTRARTPSSTGRPASTAASSTTPTPVRAASRSARSPGGCSTRSRSRRRTSCSPSAVNDNSKLLYVRNPRDRVEKVAPFLTLDGDPYPAVVDGRIQWIIDGYTTSATYPYAAAGQPASRDHRRADQPGHRSSWPGRTSTTCATR